MSALHLPAKAAIQECLDALQSAVTESDSDDVFHRFLDVFAAVGRNAAQVSWTMLFEAEDRDKLMKAHEDQLVGQVLQMPLSSIYPELPAQVEGVLRDSFDDEHFRLEDPESWAEIDAELPAPKEIGR